MKDRQVVPASAEPRIPLVSPLLHCVSMTALVYLRSSFGFGYLRPRSVFFAFSWAFILYAIYAWIDGDAWRQHRALLWFGIGATLLYWLHFLRVFREEWSETAGHDNFSGVSHLKQLKGWRKLLGREVDEKTLRLWGEPLITLILALFMRAIFGESHLSPWLVLTAFCLWAKEALNQWFHIRQRKRRKDMFEDAEDAFEDQSPNHSAQAPPSQASPRKERVKRTRASSSSLDEETDEVREDSGPRK